MNLRHIAAFLFFCVIFLSTGCTVKNYYTCPLQPAESAKKEPGHPPEEANQDKDEQDDLLSADLDLILKHDGSGKTACITVKKRIDDSLAKAFRELNFKIVESDPSLKKVILEINSPGGSVASAAEIMGYMDVWKRKGIIIETRVEFKAKSAAANIFLNGSRGYRLMGRRAELMVHHSYFSNYQARRMSLSEVDELKKDFIEEQEDYCRFLASKTNLTVEEIGKLIYKKDYFINSQLAFKQGFADGYIS